MTHYALLDGQRITAVIEAASAPSEPHAILNSWTGPPAGASIDSALLLVEGIPAWVDQRTMDQRRAAKWIDVKAWRAAAEFSPLTVGAYTFDANQESQQKIAGSVQLALMAPITWTTDWTLTDNTVCTLTRAEMVNVGVALGQRTGAIYSTARALRVQIDAASTSAELAAIVWPI